MMKQFARYVILAPLAAAAAGPALAQTIPPGQSCGGLFCDLGVIGHKVAVGPDGQPLPAPVDARGQVVVEPRDPHTLSCHDFLCRAFGQKSEDAPPPVAEPVAAAMPEAPAKPVRKAHRKHVAKVEAAAASDSAAK